MGVGTGRYWSVWGEGPKCSVAALLLALAYLLGGTSGYPPLRGMVIELAALAAILFACLTWQGPRPSAFAITAIVAVLGLPLLQLVPLPPDIWMNLPGRVVAADVVRFIDPAEWHPLTLNPDLTYRAWQSLLAPVALFLLTLQLPLRGRLVLLTLYVGLALASTILGLLQISGGGSLYLFETGVPFPLSTGLFSNRNHQALFLVMAAIMAVALAHQAPRDKPLRKLLMAGLAAVFAAGVLATSSRAGMILLILPLLFALYPLFFRRFGWKTVAILAVVPIVLFLLAQSNVVLNVVDRLLNKASEGRFVFWPDVLFAAKHYFPYGAGIGTFAESYQVVEELAMVSPQYLNRAHNDYLEVLVESGLFGAAVLLLVIAFALRNAIRTIAGSRGSGTGLVAAAAALALLAVALHSAADYPARTYAHLAFLGLLLGLLVPGPRADPSRGTEEAG